MAQLNISILSLCIAVALSFLPRDCFGDAIGLGTYQVPAPLALNPWATLPLENVSWIIGENAKRRLIYTFPNELVGDDNVTIDLEGTFKPNSFFDMTGEKGKATCAKQLSRLICLVEKIGLTMDLNSATQFLDEKYKESPAELQKRKQVLELFYKEPIGVVTIDLNH